VRAVVAAPNERGFRKGEVFAHSAPNLPEYAVAFHAVATVGGVNTTAKPLLTTDELAAQLRRRCSSDRSTCPSSRPNANRA
jgi:acyl-CoA synthetase (AMP-forming)/AMP-acid ligase II